MSLRTHIQMAAASLAIAFVLWLGVHNEDRITIPLKVPVTYEHAGDIVRLVDVKEVEVRVRASRNRLATVSSADVSVIVDNSEGFTGTRLELLEGSVKTTFGVEVDAVEPARIQVEYDRLSTLNVPVEVRWDGEPADGWRVDENTTRAEPARVRVTGPSKLLSGLQRIPTMPVSVAGASDAVRAAGVELQPPGSMLSLTDTVSVTAMVPIVPRIGTRTFDDVPITVYRGEWETSAPNPPRLEVRVEGPLPSLRRLPLGAIRLSVDVQDLQPRKGDYRVEVLRDVDAALCPGCTIQHLMPQTAVDVAVRSRKRTPATEPTATEASASSPARTDDPGSGAPSGGESGPGAPSDAPGGATDGSGRTG